ncbi:MAG: PEP-CTERM sorting domain-containing protein, partial [Bythopirellula sp.]
YEGIFSHGIQLWAKPTVTGARQDLVLDTAEHGIFITAADTWGFAWDDGSFDSGVSVASSLDSNGWAHAMELTKSSGPGGVLLVNGVAVTSRDTFYDPESTNLSIGANQAGDGNFYNGTLDDVKLFFWGDNSDQLGADGTAGGTNGVGGLNADGQDWGDLDLFATNEWIANEIAEAVPGGVLVAGDADKDGDVDDDDVNLFITGWRSESPFGVGDWNTWDNGDFNHNGVTDFADWYLLKGNHSDGANLDLGALLADRNVPEPSSVLILMLGAAGAGLAMRRR